MTKLFCNISKFWFYKIWQALKGLCDEAKNHKLQRGTNSRKGKTGDFKSVLRTTEFPKKAIIHTGTPNNKSSGVYSFYRLPAFLWESQILSDTSSSLVFISHWKVANTLYLWFSFPESSLHGEHEVPNRGTTSKKRGHMATAAFLQWMLYFSSFVYSINMTLKSWSWSCDDILKKHIRALF